MQSPSQLSKYIQQIMMSHSIINKIQPAISSEKKTDATTSKIGEIQHRQHSVQCKLTAPYSKLTLTATFMQPIAQNETPPNVTWR
jgi:hypothetical protein